MLKLREGKDGGGNENRGSLPDPELSVGAIAVLRGAWGIPAGQTGMHWLQVL